MNINALGIKRLAAHYLRYDLVCPIIGLEVASSLASTYNNGGLADILAVSKQGYLIEVEVKISLSDMKADRKKPKHEYYRKLCEIPYNNKQRRWGKIVEVEPEEYPTHMFYFAIPHRLLNNAKLLCEDMYPYAGLLTDVTTVWSNQPSTTKMAVRREAKILNHRKLSLLEATRMAKGQSATIVRLLDQIAKMDNNLD